MSGTERTSFSQCNATFGNLNKLLAIFLMWQVYFMLIKNHKFSISFKFGRFPHHFNRRSPFLSNYIPKFCYIKMISCGILCYCKLTFSNVTLFSLWYAHLWYMKSTVSENPSCIIAQFLHMQQHFPWQNAIWKTRSRNLPTPSGWYKTSLKFLSLDKSRTVNYTRYNLTTSTTDNYKSYLHRGRYMQNTTYIHFSISFYIHSKFYRIVIDIYIHYILHNISLHSKFT